MEHVAERIMLGPTKIIICDEKCIPKEETGEVLKDLARIAKPHLAKKYFEETA